jgi:hypothetical protein
MEVSACGTGGVFRQRGPDFRFPFAFRFFCKQRKRKTELNAHVKLIIISKITCKKLSKMKKKLSFS